jgi:MoxR-like ATPase
VVVATQNPVEYEGTYPLPEAQQDRFMFNIHVDYPEEEEEFRIVEMTTTTHQPHVERVLSATDILEMQDIVRKVPVAPYVIRYAMKFTRLTRKDKGDVPDDPLSRMRHSAASSGLMYVPSEDHVTGLCEFRGGGWCR